ncbi:putative parvulin-type peptidyl-prolyl cis-trans isomerase [Ralstonia wenshanensis]|uniref:peptidylprolyl isomerase n=1 Tax=Ralstonia wenshanensis TaxID=2842456 RepID=UPI0028F674B2|nr:peptidyl-prolyl cis-trans isomerase [Ralstonia wenshanensis]CAJ0816921.1 putative parvulin-type peptidyl-prolyl cis-trans isomerase [Ralstonia wenshanensis]
MKNHRTVRVLGNALLLGMLVLGAQASWAATKATAQAAPADAGPLPAGVVARVNGTAITQQQVDQAIAAANVPASPQAREAVKNQLIARELFRQAAEKGHYDARPNVRAAMEQAKTLAMTQDYLRDAVKPAPVSEADVRAKYDAIVGSLGEFEYKPSAIVVKDADTAQKVLDQIKKGTDFAQLAKQYSQGPTAAQGGALNWVSFKLPLQEGKTQNWPLPLATALTQLPDGAASASPVQVDGAFWILRVEAKRPTQIPQYDQIKDVLRKQLEQVEVQKATTKIVVDLMKNARIQQ